MEDAVDHHDTAHDVMTLNGTAITPSVTSSIVNGEKSGKEFHSHTGTIAEREREIHAGVSVNRAEAEFAQLNKELSNISHEHRRLSRTSSRRDAPRVQDLEKSTSSEDAQPFDLEETLRGHRALEEEHGIKSKRIGVLWDKLTVKGAGGSKNFIRTFPDAFVSFFNVPAHLMQLLGLNRNKSNGVNILDSLRGVAKPGEMVLVLGRPGSGCTTFLKVISNQRFGYTGIEGDVSYGPFDAATFAKRFRGEATYNGEDDVHHPTLTVKQTLAFALDLKTPGKRPAGVSKADFKNKVVDLLLRMFNIEHTANTLVGNQFIRGVSGGERKRVSIAEMMIAGSSVCAWDNSTRGLDSSTALDYAKSLRILTNIYHTTTFVSLYQASESIYRNFDKVLVIDDGHQVYYGPTKDARAYFEGLGFMPKPRQTTPDYLTGCTDAFEREYQQGYSASNAPHDARSLEKAFNDSEHSRRLDDEILSYRAALQVERETYKEFEMAHLEAKRKHASKSSVYTAPFHLQIWALIQRQSFLKWQDKFALTTSWATAILVAILLGTVWLKLPTTSAGAFTRGGLLFISLLFNAFQAFGELGSTLLGRGIVNKHRAFTFHRPSALWLAQILVDVAFGAAKILVFSILVYFLCGLVLDAGAFFTFALVIITGYLAMTLFFRTIGLVCAGFDTALRIAVIIITLFVVTSGYIIQYSQEQVWLRWIFYVNPMGLGFSAMMINEFKRIDLTCGAQQLIPSGPGYDNISHQVCTLAGGTSGNSVIPGASYVGETFLYDVGDLWRNFGIMLVLIVVFLFMNVYFGETLRFGAGGKTVTFYQKENAESKKLNADLKGRRERRRIGRTGSVTADPMSERQGHPIKNAEEEGPSLNIASKSVLTWEALNYDVPVPSGQLRLLKDVYGYVKPGQLTALMGASGAGKTTLLDVLAARKNIGVISGSILVDANEPGSGFQRGTSYAEQLDVHEPTQTVREALRFSATLRQPYHVPQEEKNAYVEEVIALLEMEDIADAMIGSPESGLAVEQRKRVTIGVELAAKPELLLFLDEPTSGLDSQSAFNIVRFLKKLAAAGQAILCTIHQPNAALFENFDRLLFLQKGGQCVYFGDIGKDAVTLIEYFRKHGAHCPDEANPAEWMLDAVGAGSIPRIGDKDWAEIWRESSEFTQTKKEIVELKESRLREVASRSPIEEREYATPLLHQILTVCRRTNLAFWRSPDYGFTRLFNHVVLALVAGLTFLQLNDSRSSLQNRVFIVFQVTVLPAIILAQVEPKYEFSRLIFYRESASKAYKQLPFVVAMVLAEMPYSILCAVTFFLPLYYLPGLQSSSSRAGYQFLMILITEVFSVTLGQMISALTPSTMISMLLNPPILIVFSLFCGVTIPAIQMPAFWRAWLYQLDPYTHLVGGMLVTELEGRPVNCGESEFNRFTSPLGQTCGQYMANFFAAGAPGYLADNSTSNCEYCAYSVGDQFYEPLGYSYEHRWRELGILAAFIGSNLILIFVGSRYLNYNRR